MTLRLRRKTDENYPEYVHDWAKRASWRKIRAAPPAGAIRNALRRMAAKHYVETYYDAEGMLPTGNHEIDLTYGLHPSNDLVIPWSINSSGRVVDTLVFPDSGLS